MHVNMSYMDGQVIIPFIGNVNGCVSAGKLEQRLWLGSHLFRGGTTEAGRMSLALRAKMFIIHSRIWSLKIWIIS